MAALAQQLEQLKLQQEELQKRIQEEEERKKKLNNEASIERLEALVQPLSNVLDHKTTSGFRDNIPTWRKSRRELVQQQYEQQLQQYNMNLLANPPRLNEYRLPPMKDEQLLKEEIFVTLIGILKNQEEKIIKLEEAIKDSYKGQISTELANFLGKTNRQVSRTEVTREITTYIRNNNLQDPQNKRRILADFRLKELFKLKPNDELTYFNLQKFLTPHFC